MLTGKQKRYLRAEAHNLKPLYQIGKEGIHENLIDGINNAIFAHELVKVKILENCTIDKNTLAIELGSRTIGEVVQLVGKTIILYKRNKDIDGYKLP